MRAVLDAAAPPGGQSVRPRLTPNEWAVVRLALETQERVMLERDAPAAAEAARLLRLKLARRSRRGWWARAVSR